MLSKQPLNKSIRRIRGNALLRLLSTLLLLLVLTSVMVVYVIDTGNVGVKQTLGKVDPV